MNSSEIYKVIQSVANTTKNNEKLAIISSHAEDLLFKKIVFYTLNPNFMYGIVPNTSWSVKGDSQQNHQNDFSDETFILLDKLINRDLTGHSARDAILDHIFTLNSMINIICSFHIDYNITRTISISLYFSQTQSLPKETMC